MNKNTLAALLAALFTSNALSAETEIQTEEVLVTANRFERKDTETTYASEVHNRQMIDASGATSLYDYLAQYTSLNVLPNFGNKVTPNIDMRGYGSATGYQNIVVTVDGQRLNNIDASSQLIGAIPLDNIDRIEITKGSGSVIYGDGAMAGTVQIYTRSRTGISVNASGGNFGAQTGNISAGISEKYFDFSVSLSHDSHDGFSKKDTTGRRDEFTSNAQHAKLKIKPTDDLRFIIEGASSRTDVRYNNLLTRAQFRSDPRQNGGGPYTHQGLDSDQWRVGFEYDITERLRIAATHYDEDKLSDFINFNNPLNYRYKSDDLSLSYNSEQLNAVVGIQTFDGERETIANFFGPANKTSKDNSAVFGQVEYRVEALTFLAGARRESVKYVYSPDNSPSLKDEEKLNSYDLGVNYRFNEAVSAFANYNYAFQTPNIDYFFTPVFMGPSVFNGFIEPAKVKQTNIGINHTTVRNRFKATVFYADLQNEIYLNPFFINTNIDDSHKYGLELQDHWRITDRLNASLIYTYTRAIIDRESDLGGALEGKNLPGVPKHGVNAGINWAFYDNANLNLSHVWRSTAYSANDFVNLGPQKQNSYESTNISVSYRYRQIQVFTAVNNIFEHKNSIQIDNDWIYPVDFARTWRVGMKLDL